MDGLMRGRANACGEGAEGVNLTHPADESPLLCFWGRLPSHLQLQSADRQEEELARDWDHLRSSGQETGARVYFSPPWVGKHLGITAH